jgi:dihydroorotase-like cyclic amidohydrolase
VYGAQPYTVRARCFYSRVSGSPFEGPRLFDKWTAPVVTGGLG